jgi:spermidine/putrescine-binding protein
MTESKSRPRASTISQMRFPCDPEILNDPQIYPPPAVQAKLFTISPYDQRTQRIVTRLWQKVKTGS